MNKPLPVYGLQEGNVCDYVSDEKTANELRRKIAEARKQVKFIGFVGGPPCPDFSVGNANAKGEKGDRGKLTKVYVDMRTVT